MNGTRELVDPQQVALALAVLMAVGFVGTVGFGLAARQKGSAQARKGTVIAAALIAPYPLWLVYNLIEDALGLDSVAGLLINLVLFLVVGIGGGLLARRAWPLEVDQPAGRQERQAVD